MRKLMLLFAIVLIPMLVIIALGSIGAAGLSAQGGAYPIRLKAAEFIPATGETPALPAALTLSGYAPGQRGYYIIQFTGPVRQAWKDAAAAAGAELLDYIPDFAFKARMTPATAARLARLEHVNWVGLFQPAYKLSPQLSRQGASLVRVQVERGAAVSPVAAAIAGSGAQLLDLQGHIALVAADQAQLIAIANLLDVAWIEPYAFKQKHNEYAAGVILGANAANTSGYDGSTQIAAVADTGLGDGTAAGAHPDIPAGRIVAIRNWPGSAGGCFTTLVNDGAQDVDSGHGTHVATSLLGDGDPAGVGKGAANAAGLVFQAVENYVTISVLCQILGNLPPAGYFLTGFPADLHSLYQQAYNDGARIHSNSWGSAQHGVYTVDSSQTDDFIWDNPDMAITFSAGNDGQDANANGVVDNDTIGSPGTAKNVITIGASENDRGGDFSCSTVLTYTSHDGYQAGQTCTSMSGQNLLGTYGARYGFAAEPLKSDITAGNAEQMAAWSGRGPTDDGRLKPDLVAPGTWILSGYSSLYREGYGGPVNPQNSAFQWDGWGMPFTGTYKYMGGTSMSNPVAAGAATVVRDFYQKDYSHSASAALVKATLINSAHDLLDENNDGADDNDFPIPNVHEGWGRVDLANAVDGGHLFIDQATGLTTGISNTYQYRVVPGRPFKVTLVWSDFAASALVAPTLVNDLDLLVTAPDGTTQYLGNVFSGGWSQTAGSADRLNNVENVYIAAPAVGNWTIQVTAFNAPQGPQPYALVIDGNVGSPDFPPTVALTQPAAGASVSGTITVTATASDDHGVASVEFFVDGGSIGLDTNAADGWSLSWNANSVGPGSHTIAVTATDTVSQTAADSITVTVLATNQAPTAAFSHGCLDLACTFNAAASSDPDGTIAGYAWDFGDGTGGTGITATHTYTTAASYNVVLVVTDNLGATGSFNTVITPTAALPQKLYLPIILKLN